MAEKIKPMSEATFRRLMAWTEDRQTERDRRIREAEMRGRLFGLLVAGALERARRGRTDR